MPAHLWMHSIFLLAMAGVVLKRIRLPGTEAANLPFSDAVWAGDTLYLSGHIGLDGKTGRPPDSAAEEARLVLESLRETLQSEGLTMNDLVSVQVFCSDVSLFGELHLASDNYGSYDQQL